MTYDPTNDLKEICKHYINHNTDADHKDIIVLILIFGAIIVTILFAMCVVGMELPSRIIETHEMEYSNAKSM